MPKVIDFGVAKATGQQLTERTIFTGFGDVIGTLEYMSPELLRPARSGGADGQMHPGAESGAVSGGNPRIQDDYKNENRPALPGDSAPCIALHGRSMTPAGFEPASPP